MATNNFMTMKDFSLVVRDTSDCYFEDGEPDYFMYEMIREEMEQEIETLKDSLLFHTIEIRDGYYSGLQYYVDCEHELDKEDDYSNDECWYYFGMCRSAAYRKFAAEKNRIKRTLNKISKKDGYDMLYHVSTFSDGSAFYLSQKELGAKKENLKKSKNIA